MPRPKQPVVEKKCYFSVNGYKDVDYKDVQTLRRFMSSYGRILPQKKTGLSSKFQRKMTVAVKRARHMALLPFTRR